jgi:hypothetical protein
MNFWCYLGLGIVGYWLLKSNYSPLGMVATTEPHTTVRDTTDPRLFAHFFDKFNADARNAYYRGDDYETGRNLWLAQAALQNTSSEDVIRRRGQWEDIMAIVDPVRLGTPIVSGEIPPLPPW